MRHHIRIARTAAALGLVVAVVAAGCGRRQPVSPSAGVAATDGVAAVESPAATGGATTPTAPDGPAAGPTGQPAPTPPPTAAPATPAPAATPAPFVAPDLTAIQRLLDDLDAALGADATADTDEGSAP